jgi:hypothetical protein
VLLVQFANDLRTLFTKRWNDERLCLAVCATLIAALDDRGVRRRGPALASPSRALRFFFVFVATLGG